MELNERPFGNFVGKYFSEHVTWPESRTSIVDEWRPTVEEFVDGFTLDEAMFELMSLYQSGFVQDQIEKMSAKNRASLLEFLEEGREELTGTVAVSLKCAAHDFGKALERFVAELGSKKDAKSSAS